TVPICNGRAAGSATAGRKSNGCALRMNTDDPGTTEPVVTGCHTVVPGAIPMTRPSCNVIVPVAGSTFATMPAASTRGAPGAIDDAGAVVTNTGVALDDVAMVPVVRGVGVMTLPADGVMTVPVVAGVPELAKTQPGWTSARRTSRPPT